MKWWYLLKATFLVHLLYEKHIVAEEEVQESVNVNLESFKNKSFFTTNFYNTTLAKEFTKEDFHFFRLLFLKILYKTGLLNKNNSIPDVISTLEHIKFGINQTSDNLYMTLIDEMQLLNSHIYIHLYLRKKVSEQILMLKMKDSRRQKLENLIPFSTDRMYRANESYKKLHLVLDILHLSIVIIYKNINETTKKNMLKSLYEKKIDQWTCLNLLRKLMKYKLMMNSDKIVSYIVLQTEPQDISSSYTITSHQTQLIGNHLKKILQSFTDKLYPDILGNENSGYFIDKDTKVFMPDVQVTGYITNTENKYQFFENDTIHIKSKQFFEQHINHDKIIIQLLISYPEKTHKEAPKENDINITIEYCYNILVNYFHYNNQNFLSYRDANIFASYLLHGKSPYEEYENEEKNKEKKYEELSLHIFLKIKKKMPFNFKRVHKFIKKNTTHILPEFYAIHFYGACYKSPNNDIVQTMYQFGDSVDNNFIKIIMLEMKSNDIIAHLKLYTHKDKQKLKRDYLSANNIKQKLDETQVFEVLYYFIDSTKEIPQPINCSKCRYKKYHYMVLIVIAVVPSLIIFAAFYIYYYMKSKKQRDKPNDKCLTCCSTIFPCLFYVRVSSHSFLRLNKSMRKKINKKNGKSVLSNKSSKKSRNLNTNNKITAVHPHV